MFIFNIYNIYMPYRHKRIFKTNQFLHIYNRGNRKQEIFYDQEDYSFFVRKMFFFQRDYDLAVLSYCLMPNHYHLLINTCREPISITPYMHRFMTSYSRYLNKKYSLVGHVFQNEYQAREITSIKDLQNMTEYIKENPIKAGLCRDINDYKWYMEAKLENLLFPRG